MGARSKKSNRDIIRDIRPETANKSTGIKPGVEEKSYAIFRVANEFYCIDPDSIFEILHDFAIIPVSHLPEIYEGIINLKGESIPIVNLRTLLNFNSEQTHFYTCIILITDGTKTGYLVDSDVEIVKSTECTFFALPDCFSPEEQKFLDGIIEYKDRLIGVIRLDQALKILSEWRLKSEDK